MGRARAVIVLPLLLLVACRKTAPIGPTTIPSSARASVHLIVLVANPARLPIGGGSTEITVVTSGDSSGTSAAPNATVALSASTGSLSAQAVQTDFTGHAKVTWTGTASTTISASTEGASSSVAVAVDAAPAPPAPSPAPGPAPAPPPGPTTGGSLAVEIGASPPRTSDATPVDFFTTVRDAAGDVSRVGMTYGWDFESDGRIDSGDERPHHLFPVGDWTITVDVKAADGRSGRGTYRLSVVQAPPEPPTITMTATATPATPTVGQSVTFTATATGNAAAGAITGYAWSFGDGETATGATVSHTYTKAGTFTPSVTATSAAGATATKTLTSLVVSPRALLVSLSASQTSAAPNASFTFTATATSLDPPAAGSTYQWDFNNDGTFDATTGTANSASQIINGPVGTKQTIRVKVTAPDGRVAENTITIVVS